MIFRVCRLICILGHPDEPFFNRHALLHKVVCTGNTFIPSFARHYDYFRQDNWFDLLHISPIAALTNKPVQPSHCFPESRIEMVFNAIVRPTW